jgi:hypothetical protein
MRDGGEVVTKVAIRVDLFAQVRADASLRSLRQRTFAARCKRYGVGESTLDERPEGQHVVVLHQSFVEELLAGFSNEIDIDLEQYDLVDAA